MADSNNSWDGGDKLLNSLRARMKAEENLQEIKRQEHLRKTSIVRAILDLPGVTVVPIEGIEANTIVVSKEIYDMMREDIIAVYNRKTEELLNRRFVSFE